jgi:hypothetical protein
MDSTIVSLYRDGRPIFLAIVTFLAGFLSVLTITSPHHHAIAKHAKDGRHKQHEYADEGNSRQALGKFRHDYIYIHFLFNSSASMSLTINPNTFPEMKRNR